MGLSFTPPPLKKSISKPVVPNLSHFVAPENYIMIIAQLRDIFSDPVIKSVMVSIAIGQENYKKTS